MARKSRKNIPAVTPQIEPQSVLYDVAGYVRLSAVDRKQKGDSIETQQAIIRAFVAEHPDLNLREIYIDNGVSGMTFERPAFQRMLADAEQGKINCVVTKDLSRAGRNAIDTGYYIEKYFPAHGLRFIAINDHYDSADGVNGGMMVTLKNIVNETYALEIGRKVRATKQMNIREGAFVGRNAPYGYLKSKTDPHKLVVDPYAAPYVRRMFEMAADGCGVGDIQNLLHRESVLPPKKHFYQMGLVTAKEANGPIHWNKGMIYTILHNQVYTGDMVQGKGRTNSYVVTRVPQAEWVVVENTHEPIVSRALWERVQQRWPGPSTKGKTPYSENIFLRKVFCGHCGHAMSRTRYSGDTYGFKCTTQLMYDKSDCILVSIPEADLKDELFSKLCGHMGSLLERPAPAVEPDPSDLRKLQYDIGKANTYLKGLYESLMLGDITQDDYREMKQSYEAQISALSKQAQTLREERLRCAEMDAKRNDTSLYMNGLQGIQDLNADIIKAYVERIEVYTDKSVKVHFLSDQKITAETEGAGHA